MGEALAPARAVQVTPLAAVSPDGGYLGARVTSKSPEQPVAAEPDDE